MHQEYVQKYACINMPKYAMENVHQICKDVHKYAAQSICILLICKYMQNICRYMHYMITSAMQNICTNMKLKICKKYAKI